MGKVFNNMDYIYYWNWFDLLLEERIAIISEIETTLNFVIDTIYHNNVTFIRKKIDNFDWYFKLKSTLLKYLFWVFQEQQHIFLWDFDSCTKERVTKDHKNRMSLSLTIAQVYCSFILNERQSTSAFDLQKAFYRSLLTLISTNFLITFPIRVN